ncbi:hypothetical protein DERP_003062 [Dermatophagoides pteronyssinus]|uniref:Uncharacterized protein n=1 Tax=Dermatophagoides pteronyssinus TaxID=6956 RepID=A0ABQ8JIS2_DERPT|nr:hypothetical protein DERP_003062 [Dermatophagoides pteronyssinus]
MATISTLFYKQNNLLMILFPMEILIINICLFVSFLLNKPVKYNKICLSCSLFGTFKRINEYCAVVAVVIFDIVVVIIDGCTVDYLVMITDIYHHLIISYPCLLFDIFKRINEYCGILIDCFAY